MKSFAPELQKLKAAGRYRALQQRCGIDLSSNDYLGLAVHPALRQAAIAALADGIAIGAGGSRLLRGNHDAHEELEKAAAAYFDSPRCLFFANGFIANHALITTLIARHDSVVYDALVHASMRDGLHAAHCQTIKAAHNDLNAFEDALKKNRGAAGQMWILAESVYSMEGDIAPVHGLVGLAEKYDAYLILDEAHGTGVHGLSGRGVSEGLAHDRLITLHTCGKALGVAGALVCASAEIIDYLVNAARPFIYSTAPMPLQAVLVKRALQLAQEEPQRRAHLATLVRHAAALFPGRPVYSQIVPIPIGRDEEAVACAQALQAQGFDIRAIRPPTVPAGTARLRLSLHAGLTEKNLDDFAALLRPLLERAEAA